MLNFFPRYEEMSQEANPMSDDGSRKNSYNRLFPVLNNFVEQQELRLHNYEAELLPKIDPSDMKIYGEYIERGLTMECRPSKEDLDVYRSYVKMSQQLIKS